MKYVKMLGLAAVAAMALTAFLGASSASATVLCKTATNPCGSAWLKTGSLEASIASESTSVLKSTGGSLEDTCSSSTVGGTITSQGENQNVVGSISTLTFTTCTKPTAVLEQTGTLELEGTTVKAKGFRVTVEAVSGVSCVYSAGTGTTLGTFTGGNPAIIHVNAVVNKSSGSFLCPSDSLWEGTYTITGVGTLHSEPS
jgi:hypothetical protein